MTEQTVIYAYMIVIAITLIVVSLWMIIKIVCGAINLVNDIGTIADSKRNNY